ncbi:MAG: hypothetical protein ABIB71_09785 [Candidatus Woesearchaeota archaeon]
MDSKAYYSRKEVREAILEAAKDREVGVRYGDGGFGKRPSLLQFQGDVAEYSKEGCTSFHISEERWNDIMALQPGMTKRQLDENRAGWDLVFDIDHKHWGLAKYITYFIIEAIKFHEIKSVTAKFSVTGDTLILCQINKVKQLLPIKDIIDKFRDGNEISVLSLNNDLSISFNKIYDSLEHKKRLFKLFHSNSNMPVVLSPDHSVYIFSGRNIITKETRDLKIGDYVISFKGADMKFKKNLKVTVKYKLRGFWFEEKLKLTKEFMRLIGYYLAEGHLWEKGNLIGFSFHIKEKEYIEDVLGLISKLEGTRAYYNIYSKYLKDKKKGKKRSELIKKHGEIVKAFLYANYTPTVKQVKGRKIVKEEVNTTQILFYSSKWASFFKEFCSNGSHNKKVPSFIFNLPKEYFMELLKGYLRGDGHIKEYCIEAKSVSKQLTTALVWLCKIHGIACSYSEQKEKEHKLPNGTHFKGSYTHLIRIPRSEFSSEPELYRKSPKFGSKPNDYLVPVFPLRKVYKQCKPKKFLKHRLEQNILKKNALNKEIIKKIIKWFKEYKSIQFNKESKDILLFYNKILESNLSFFKIRRIEASNNKKTVYDISVKNSENFFGGNVPILLHNSGGKGFHIAIPFEAMPKEVHGKDINTLYPEAARIVAGYIKDFIYPYLIEKLPEIESKYGAIEVDMTCGREHHDIKKMSQQPMNLSTTSGVISVEGTNRVISQKDIAKRKKLIVEMASAIDPNKATEIDGVLISCRHLFRAPYSLHEKSGKVSVPVDVDNVLEFEKEMASVDKVKFDIPFLVRENVKENEASALFIQAMDWNTKICKREDESEEGKKEFEAPTVALKEEYFPPCIKEILKGELKDGRKRAVFILINFLHHTGWDWESVKKMLDEWNKKMEEPLRENYVLEQFNWRKKQKSNILPPNCNKDGYYRDLQLCSADGLCSKIRNPVNYCLLRSRMASKVKKKVKKKN